MSGTVLTNAHQPVCVGGVSGEYDTESNSEGRSCAHICDQKVRDALGRLGMSKYAAKRLITSWKVRSWLGRGLLLHGRASVCFD